MIPKISLWSTCQSGGLGRSGDSWNFSLGPSHSEPSESLNSVAIFPVLKCVTGLDILRNWQNSYIGSLIYEVISIIVQTVKEVPLELPFLKKIVKQYQYCTPEKVSEISATIKDLKDAGVGVPLQLI